MYTHTLHFITVPLLLHSSKPFTYKYSDTNFDIYIYIHHSINNVLLLLPIGDEFRKHPNNPKRAPEAPTDMFNLRNNAENKLPPNSEITYSKPIRTEIERTTQKDCKCLD